MVGRPCGQFQGERMPDRCCSTVRMAGLSRALPIMMEERQAREASMARTLHTTNSMAVFFGGAGTRGQHGAHPAHHARRSARQPSNVVCGGPVLSHGPQGIFSSIGAEHAARPGAQG